MRSVLKSSKNLASITTKVAIEPCRETACNKLGTAGEADRGQERAVLLQDVLLVVAGKHNIYTTELIPKTHSSAW